MKEYFVEGLTASSTGPKTAATVIGSTTMRGQTNYYLFGFRTAPNTTDQQINCAITSNTNNGTAGTNPTPKPRDPADIPAVCTVGITHSAEPTGPADFINFDLNQRASKEFNFDYGREIVGAIAVTAPVSARMVLSVAAIVMSCVVGWRE